ncbi:hypothetical protein PLEOSDRAFT_1074877 [Pleurotus ostreatus PC15]|uniref:Uncharacterized protein n=2 Tax=Pleurotus TaxID=5320 RepID=A0A067NR57_PLEO1|nr:hypothetical protein CCMSSC00406_0000278 [Pleurotus cornucopiae]KDQ30558.1 hypothetical protein PLEOSDRAFT_1074877 [Pleurotus ostreatus PC15]
MAEPTTLSVHRCRFVDFAPSAITALALPPLPLPSPKGKNPAPSKEAPKFGTLAVGHANGNIDLCEWSPRQLQSSQAWVTRQTLSAPYPSKVDSLVFVIRHPERLPSESVPSCSDLRLFSSGGGSDLLEWDLEKDCVRRTLGSQGGSIWCMAANPASSTLALGCEDGTVRLISLVHDTLTHLRKFDKVKCRILSLAWGPPIPRATQTSTQKDDDDSSEDEEEDWTDSWIVTGGSDSSLRKWDVSTGRVVDRLMVDKTRGERTLVWTVGALGDGTIISGDSLGNVKFWDSRTCTQIQSFPAHGADVLCLICGPDGGTVYTSGVDQKVTQFSFIKAQEGNSTTTKSPASRWVQSASRRLHAHDVRALAMWPPYTILPSSHRRRYPIDVAPILASGGLDMTVVLTPAALSTNTIVKVINPLNTSSHATFDDAYHRKIAYTTGPSSTSGLCIAKATRLLTCMRERSLSIWRIHPKVSAVDEEDAEGVTPVEGRGWDKVLDMELNVNTNLVACRISDDARWLVVSDLYETKLFSLNEVDGDIIPSRIRDFSSTIKAQLPEANATTGALAFAFTPDSSKLAMSVALSGYILIIDLHSHDEKPTVLRRFNQHRKSNGYIGNRVVRGRRAVDADLSSGSEAEEDEKDEEEIEEQKPILARITRMVISADGQWLATSDDLSRTHIFNMDSIQHHCILPSSPLPVQTMSFDPKQPNILIMAFPNNTMQIYDVEAKQSPIWAQDFCNSLPKRFTHAHDPVLGIAFDSIAPAASDMVVDSPAPAPQRFVLLWGSTWICKLNYNPLGGRVSKKRHRETNAETSESQTQTTRHFKMITQYRPILYVDFVASGELVVVERPLVDVLATLPPAYFKPKYGAS